MLTKACTKCGEEKPATSEFFGKVNRNKNGFRSECKVCQSKMQKKYREENQDKIKAYQKEYDENNRDRKKERAKEYYENNKEHCKEKNRINGRKYYKRNKDKIKERNRSNKAKRCAQEAKRRAMIRNSLPSLSKQEHKQITQLYKQAQELSKSDMFNAYHIDHVIPLRGKLPDGKRVLGAHRLSNLQLLMDCENLSKFNNITYKDLKKATEGIDYIFVPNDYHDDPNKYPEIGFDVELCFN